MNWLVLACTMLQGRLIFYYRVEINNGNWSLVLKFDLLSKLSPNYQKIKKILITLGIIKRLWVCSFLVISNLLGLLCWKCNHFWRKVLILAAIRFLFSLLDGSSWRLNYLLKQHDPCIFTVIDWFRICLSFGCLETLELPFTSNWTNRLENSIGIKNAQA